MEGVVGLALHRRASLKPPGDVIVVAALNRAMDAILKQVAAIGESGPVSVETAEVASLTDPERQESIEDDSDEAIWEEMESGLRHQARPTINYLLLMALGGAVATCGLVSPPGPQAVYFVASAIISPGLESLGKATLALVLRDRHLLWRALKSFVAGYGVLVVASALTYALLAATGIDAYAKFIGNEEVGRIAHPTAVELLVSACGAVTGMLMYSTYRETVIAGPVVALVIIPAAAMIGMALTAGRVDLAWQAIERVALDGALIVGAGLAVFGLKQAFLHRRRPLA